jgi:hypothetical protein
MTEFDPAFALSLDKVRRHTDRLRPLFRGAGFLSVNELLECDLLSLGLSPVLEGDQVMVQGRGIDCTVQAHGALKVTLDSEGELTGRTIAMGVWTPRNGFVGGMIAPEMPAGYQYRMCGATDEAHHLLQPIGICRVNGIDIF